MRCHSNSCTHIGLIQGKRHRVYNAYVCTHAHTQTHTPSKMDVFVLICLFIYLIYASVYSSNICFSILEYTFNIQVIHLYSIVIIYFLVNNLPVSIVLCKTA